jgi:hypothetical protein
MHSVVAPITFLIGLLLSFGIGSGAGESPRAGHSERFQETPAERHHANCTRAEVVADSPSTIVFTVACHAPSYGDTLGFGLARGEGQSVDTPGIRSFTHHPRLTGPGAVRRWGKCQWWVSKNSKFKSFGCDFPANGRVSMVGAIRVRAGTECSRPISITTKVTTCDPNRGGVCPANLVIRSLWSGLPTGC